MPGLKSPSTPGRTSPSRLFVAEMDMRCRIVALSLLLSACGDEQSPQQASEPSAVSAVPSAPPVTVAQPATVTPATSSREVKAEPPPSLPPASVDLSLPQQLIDELSIGDSSASMLQSTPLLPPLFVEKPKPQSSFQLNGRLLTDDQLKDDYLESVEGAEIQLQYKH